MPEQNKPRIALVGTDSMPGKEVMDVLSRKKFPVKKAEFFDPGVKEEYSKLTQFNQEPRVIHSLDRLIMEELDLIFLAGDKQVNKKIGTQAIKNKVFAIDLSGAFWGQEEVSVIVSGINDREIDQKGCYLVENPHPVTIMLSHILKKAIQKFGIVKTVSFVLQPVSAFGTPGVEELAGQSADILNKGSSRRKVFKAQIAFNLLSQSESVDDDGISQMERRMLSELKRTLKDHQSSISLVQAPVFHGYSVMTYMEFEKEADITSIEGLYRESDDFQFYSPSLECPVSPALTSGKEKIFIGQVKKDIVCPNSYWIWAVADNLTVGSALNAYHIALKMVSRKENST
ncbi:MAG: hypothetical protein GF421_08540 [Candidatus Aminicenantes bacterium]|nr:hypothetical protein [Candidatus Aminicenantes bacterium]